MKTLPSIFVLMVITSACGDAELTPETPEGAFGLFVEAMKTRDEDAVWTHLDKGTHLLVAERYRSLIRIDKIIELYFDPSEHRYMRNRTGADLLHVHKMKTAVDLYRFIFTLDIIDIGRDEIEGVKVEEVVYPNEDDDTVAEILTRGNQRVVMIEEEGAWKVAALRTLFEQALQPLEDSEKAIREFAKDNLLEERARRKELIEFANAYER